MKKEDAKHLVFFFICILSFLGFGGIILIIENSNGCSGIVPKMEWILRFFLVAYGLMLFHDRMEASE